MRYDLMESLAEGATRELQYNGYSIVPNDATKEMIEKGLAAYKERFGESDDPEAALEAAWEAMVDRARDEVWNAQE